MAAMNDMSDNQQGMMFDTTAAANAESERNARMLLHNVFNETKCYDLMQSSSKGTVFETSISFQLAFFALVEHDTDVAPLWDPEMRAFVGLMTVGDYIQALRIWRAQNLATTELTSRSIADMLLASPLRFKHYGFSAIDAEDSVYQMCRLLLRTGHDYVPVVDADSGNLVSILGHLDIVHLLDQAAKQHPQLLAYRTLQSAQIGTYSEVLTAPRNARLCDVLDALESRNISAIPVVDETQGNRVVGIYHRSDVAFILKAADPDVVISNLSTFTIGDSLTLRDQLLHSGDIISSFQGLVVCKITDTLGHLLNALIMGRSTRAVVVNDTGNCIGLVSAKDILRHFFSDFR